MARIFLVVGHSRTGSYCEALARSYERGAQAAGHETTLFVTSRMAFDPILRVGFSEIQQLEPDLQAAHDALIAADHLVIFFPLWFSELPVILQGFFNRVLQPDIFPFYQSHKFPKLLKGKSARVVVTMGMPGFVYLYWFRAHALKILRKITLGGMGVAKIRTTIYGNVEGVGVKGRERWLKQVEELGRHAI